MTCLKHTPAAPPPAPALLALLQPLTAQAARRFEHVLASTLDALGPDAFGAIVGSAAAAGWGRPDAAEIEYASWMPDPGAIEMASWAAAPQHTAR